MEKAVAYYTDLFPYINEERMEELFKQFKECATNYSKLQ